MQKPPAKYLYAGAAMALAFILLAWEVGYQNGFDSARTLLAHSRLNEVILQLDRVPLISGTVTRVDGNRITLDTEPNNPLDLALVDRTVIVATSTSITIVAVKDAKVFQNEVAAFEKSKSAGTRPSPYIQKPGTVADIRVGTALVVTGPRDAQSLKEFTAQGIQIQVKPQASSAP